MLGCSTRCGYAADAVSAAPPWCSVVVGRGHAQRTREWLEERGCRLQHGDEFELYLLEAGYVSFFLYPEATPRLALQYRSGSLPLAAERGVVRLRRPVAVERQQLESG